MADAAKQEALLRAVESGSPEAIRAAVRDGANVNADEGVALHNAVSPKLGPERSAECVRCLLELGATVAASAGTSDTALHSAAEYGYVAALKALLEADGRVALSTFDDIGRTPLHCAVDGEHVEAATLLLDAGADVNAHHEATVSNTPLSEAVQLADVRMVELLLRHGADPLIPGWMQLTALDHARRQARERKRKRVE